MAKASGIINMTGNHIWVEGMQDYRPIGAFSFLGRYRVVDFPMSNFSNSGIDRISVVAGSNPRSLTEHLGDGRHYNINSKRGNVEILFAENNAKNSIYNTDIACFSKDMENIKKMHREYVVIAPSHIVYKMDYSKALEAHIASGADITVVYHNTQRADILYPNCYYVTLNKQKGVLSFDIHKGDEACRDISLDTYIMKTELFEELVNKAKSLSSMYTLTQVINASCADLDVRGYEHKGFIVAITDLQQYFYGNLELLDMEKAEDLINEDWPIYTRTNDSCPTKYYDTADVKHSVISNGCLIEGTVENSIIGRGCTIKKGAVIKNSLILPDSVIEEGVVVECQVVDKHSKLIHCDKLIAEYTNCGYVKRGDTL